MFVFDFTSIFARRNGQNGGDPSLAAYNNARTDSNTLVRIGATSTGQSVFWPTMASSGTAAAHSVIFGGSGSGKSFLTAAAVLGEWIEARRRGVPMAAFVVDPKAELVSLFKAGCAAMSPEYLGDVVVLSPFERRFPCNLLKLDGAGPPDVRAATIASLVGTISTGMGGVEHLKIGARQLDIFLGLLLAAHGVDHPKASVHLALDALNMKGGLKALAGATTNERAKAFLSNLRMGDELTSSVLARLRMAFAANDDVSAMLAADACVQFRDILGPGKLCLMPLDPPWGNLSLGQFWANLWVRLVLQWVMARPSPCHEHPLRVVIDECQLVAPVLKDCLEDVLARARSKRVALSLISQSTAGLHDANPSLLTGVITNTPTRLFGRAGPRDATFAAQFVTPSEGSETPVGRLRQRFFGELTNLRDRHFLQLLPGAGE